ncbi:MAG: acylphosphatase [Ferruginibacter sp.]
METVHILVTGQVQGVFFRRSTKLIAIENHLSGWVRNLEDGRVEIMAQGKEMDLRRFEGWCRMGPKNASVKEVTREEVIGAEQFEKFIII